MKKIRNVVLLMIAIVMTSYAAFAGNWVQEGINWKYLDTNGAYIVNDWKFIQTGMTANYYFFDELGNMVRGIRKINGSYYSFNYDGDANSHNQVVINGTVHKTGKKGLISDIYSDFDVDAWNAEFFAAHNLTPEQKAYNEALKAEEEAKKQAAAEAAAIAEKKGPSALTKAIPTDKNSGPGMFLG